MEKIIRNLARHAAGGEWFEGLHNDRILYGDGFDLNLDATDKHWIELRADIHKGDDLVIIHCEYDNETRRWPSKPNVMYYQARTGFLSYEFNPVKAKRVASEHLTWIEDKLEGRE